MAVHGVDAHTDDDQLDVFDVDALVAESSRKPFRFRFDGDLYTLPPSPDIRAVAVLADAETDPGAMTKSLAILLGKDQWKRMLESEASLDAWTMTEILNRYAKHGGLDLPNSSASTRPSANTVPPSKRTSNGSTRRRSQAS